MSAVPVAKASRGRRWFRWLLALPFLFAAASVVQVVVLRFVDPPFTAFMAARVVEAWGKGEFGFRVAYEWRDLDRMAASLPLSMVAAEDQNFASHHGFDLGAIEKARLHNRKMVERAEKRGRPVTRLRGASTISQQVAKNLFLWQGSNRVTRWARKGLEAWYTVLIEALWPKTRILEVYANVAEFGDGVYGGQAAARRYWGKDAAGLTANESARLAAVLPSPRRYSAHRPGPYVQRRATSIQRQVRQIGGTAYLETLQ
ncbi:monofunctional biosynthetic peptidoglycan transglycosylase [Pseudoxanthomonas sp. LjRoot143]|uniref:monofunctional biosynthetic peptidoglycan transglycosylase n=1 Tax=Pseudoxanthomonas sp. LjRoot143 TaxID=3342266 RepID=UPI003ECE5769